MMTDKIIIRRPDDWHVHLRDGPMLSQVVNFTAKQFKRAIIMPNSNSSCNNCQKRNGISRTYP